MLSLSKLITKSLIQTRKYRNLLQIPFVDSFLALNFGFFMLLEDFCFLNKLSIASAFPKMHTIIYQDNKRA